MSSINSFPYLKYKLRVADTGRWSEGSFIVGKSFIYPIIYALLTFIFYLDTKI